MRIVFYISGHGYGHAVRDIEIAKSVIKRDPNAEIHFRTAAPTWLFQPLLNGHVNYHRRELDFGVLQQNSFSADKKQTFESYAALIDQKERLLNQEIDFLSAERPDIILSDITPFAFDAGEAFGKKAVAIGNFSWDWIYSDYLTDLPQYEFVVQDIKASYAKAERLYRLPFYGDMSAFPEIENVPLVGRRAGSSSDAIRRRLKIPLNDGRKYVLLGLRMNDLQDVKFDRMENLKDITFVAVSRDVPLNNCIRVDDSIAPFEDILNACDAVISKPGYSIVSEVIVNHTPMLFVPRNDFVEDPALINGLQKYAVAEQLSQQNFFAGNWADAFERLFAKPLLWPEIDANGADAIAEDILQILETG